MCAQAMQEKGPLMQQAAIKGSQSGQLLRELQTLQDQEQDARLEVWRLVIASEVIHI